MWTSWIVWEEVSTGGEWIYVRRSPLRCRFRSPSEDLDKVAAPEYEERVDDDLLADVGVVDYGADARQDDCNEHVRNTKG